MESEVTKLLAAVNDGQKQAYDRLLQAIYTHLHRLAESRMRRERAGHTLQPTELVNEAYLRMAEGDVQWENRRHFFGAAAEAMRRVLIDHARKRLSEKRGGDAHKTTFSEMNVAAEDPDIDVIALDEAIQALETERPRLGQIVRLRYFAGTSIEETAEILEIGPATVKRDWTYARAWLYERMTNTDA